MSHQRPALSRPYTWLAVALLAGAVQADYHWPSPQYDALEEFYFEGIRGDGTGLGGTVEPCRARVTGTNRIAAAEWIRMAYHDAAGYTDDGQGGMDGSIVFELDRGTQNIGQGMVDSVNDMKSFPNKYVSRADVLAASVPFAVAACGGPVIPYRGGRVDATNGGIYGVPEPFEDLATHTSIFARQGFSASDMTGLVACGHSMGGMRSTDFPDVVPAQNGSTTDNPTFGLFDTTQLQFDNAVVLEYLNGTTPNPLVTTSNTTMQSDLRIFSQDNNSTMQTLSDSDTFQSTCRDLFTRMINLVAKNVTLSDEVALVEAKVSAVQLSVDDDKLSFKSTLRLINTPNNSKRTVTMFWCDRYGDNKDCAGNVARYASYATTSTNQSPVTSAMGLALKKYIFSVQLEPSQSISKFWFQVNENNGTDPTTYDNGGTGYVIEQDQVLFVPSKSQAVGYIAPPDPSAVTLVRRGGEQLARRGGDATVSQTNGTNYGIVIAVKDGTSPSRVYMDVFDNTLASFVAFNQTMDLQLNSSISSAAGYNFYYTGFNITGSQTTIDVHADVDGTTYTDDYRFLSWISGSSSSAASTIGTTSVSAPSASSTSGSNGAAGMRAMSVTWMVVAACVLPLVLRML